MATTTEVPPEDWPGYLPAFSARNLGRLTRLETTSPPSSGGPVVAECQPLLAVDVDPKGSEAPAIVVTLGGVGPDDPDFRHVIRDPTHLWVDEEVGGLAVGLTIESRDDGRTVLGFEPEDAMSG